VRCLASGWQIWTRRLRKTATLQRKGTIRPSRLVSKQKAERTHKTAQCRQACEYREDAKRRERQRDWTGPLIKTDISMAGRESRHPAEELKYGWDASYAK
jgi:hypothetical protein